MNDKLKKKNELLVTALEIDQDNSKDIVPLRSKISKNINRS